MNTCNNKKRKKDSDTEIENSIKSKHTVCVLKMYSLKQKKFQMKILLNKSRIAPRKCKGNRRLLNTGDLKHSGALEKLICQAIRIQIPKDFEWVTSLFWES